MAAPKITVIIPTRERLPVLRHCVRTVLAQDYHNLQILISDNASTDGTGEFVQSLDDARIRYVNSGRRLSMSGNWEFALSHLDDGWVIFLGDDDGLLPGAIAALAEIIDRTDCEAITFRACNYVWPGPSGSNDVGRLVIPFCRGQEVRRTADWLPRVINSQTDYSDLPMIYTLGLVNMRLINRIPRPAGRFFNSCIPDVYASIAIARAADTYLYLDQPFSLIGNSKFSNGGSFVGMSANSAAGGEYRRFTSENDISFHPAIAQMPGWGCPLSWQMVVYEAFLQSNFIATRVQDPPPERQLALALAHPYSPEHRDALNREWGRGFARLHGLDFDAAWAVAKSIRRRAKVGSLIRRLRSLRESLVIFDRSVAIENVYAASLVAATALWTRPSLMTRLSRAGHYAFKRIVSGKRR